MAQDNTTPPAAQPPSPPETPTTPPPAPPAPPVTTEPPAEQPKEPGVPLLTPEAAASLESLEEGKPLTPEEQAQQLLKQLGRVLSECKNVATLLAPPSNAPQIPAEADGLGADDVLFSYDVRFTSAGGAQKIVKGDFVLHNCLSQSNLPESRRNFEYVWVGNVLRPVYVIFQDLLQSRVINSNAPALPTTPTVHDPTRLLDSMSAPLDTRGYTDPSTRA